jgi:hypothetical protein
LEKIMKRIEFSETTVVPEYQAMRAEIILRLGFQQQLLNLSLITIGFLVPISGLFAVSAIDPRGVLLLLLVGPIVSAFLQLIYIKQFIYIQQLSSYIVSGLGLAQTPVFSGWEKHLNSKLIKPRLVNTILGFTGGAEALFPSIAGGVYLVVFSAAAYTKVSNPSLATVLILGGGAVFDSILLLTGFIIFLIVRIWGHNLRIKTEKSLLLYSTPESGDTAPSSCYHVASYGSTRHWGCRARGVNKGTQSFIGRVLLPRSHS